MNSKMTCLGFWWAVLRNLYSASHSSRHSFECWFYLLSNTSAHHEPKAFDWISCNVDGSKFL